MPGKRRRESRRKRRRGRNRQSGPTTRAVEVVQIERPSVTNGTQLEPTTEALTEEKRPPVDVSPSLQAASLVGVLPLLLPAKQDAETANPLQGLKNLVSRACNWVWNFLGRIFNPPLEEPESVADEEHEADREYSRLLELMNQLCDQLLGESEEVRRVELEKQLEELQCRRMKLQEARGAEIN